MVFTSKYDTEVVKNPVNLISSNGRPNYVINYNLMGTIVKGVSLNWLPWLLLEDCDSQVNTYFAVSITLHVNNSFIRQGQNCQECQGMMADFMEKASEMFNFTFSCNKDPLGKWGSRPVTGTW